MKGALGDWNIIEVQISGHHCHQLNSLHFSLAIFPLFCLLNLRRVYHRTFPPVFPPSVLHYFQLVIHQSNRVNNPPSSHLIVPAISTLCNRQVNHEYNPNVSPSPLLSPLTSQLPSRALSPSYTHQFSPFCFRSPSIQPLKYPSIEPTSQPSRLPSALPSKKKRGQTVVKEKNSFIRFA